MDTTWVSDDEKYGNSIGKYKLLCQDEWFTHMVLL